MNTLVIESLDGAHYGFVLFADDEESRDCIFQLLPTTTEGFDEPGFQFLENYGFRTAGEHKWKRIGDEIILDLSSGEKAHIDLTSGTLTFGSKAIYLIKDTQTEQVLPANPSQH